MMSFVCSILHHPDEKLDADVRTRDDGVTCFGAALAQIAGAIGAQGLAKILIKVGFSSSLAFFLASALRAFFTTGVIEGNMMAPPNDEIVPSHSGSGGPSHSPSWKEDSFEINVLLEESETEGTSARSSGAARDEAGPPRQDYINRSFEASMRNRILRLEQDDSPYLLGKAKGTYWSDIRLMLEHAPSQNEYNRLLEFENKDLQIRELQHECFRLFEGFLKQNPPLSDQVPYNPQEAFKDFLNEDYEKRDQRFPFFIFDRDEKELDFLSNVRQRLKKEGPAYILAESEFAAPTITKLIPIPFSTSGASVAYNVNPVADQFQRAFQTSTFCNRLYSFFNKRWFFDQVFNDFLVRSFLRFGYEVSFEALDKGAIEILGPYGISYTFRRLAERISQLQSGFVVRRVRYDPWPPAWRQLPVLSLLSFLSSKEDCWKNRDPVFRSQQGSHREKVAIGRTCGWIESYALKFFKSGFMDKPSAKRRRNAISQSQLRSPLRSFRTAPERNAVGMFELSKSTTSLRCVGEVSWLFRARAKRARSDPSWNGLAIPDGQVRQANHACCVKPSLNGNANSTASNYLNLRRIREQRLLSAAVAARILKLTHIKNRNGKKKDLLHAREPEQKKEIGSTCTPERNQDQQLHLTELKQQIQEILGSVDQVKAAYRGTSHERPTRSSYFTPGTKQWSFFPQYPLLYFWTYSLALR
ncbi:NADH dehydrogenase subunit 5 [Tanacetum coccineum]|uniref:NADH dehydrogenase subunit 5 n=1 Tax=Tanacetum coccineum TaxID=301880 RepID=A0ABQ5BVJ4_9ASTR